MNQWMNTFYFANEGIYRDMSYQKKIQIKRVTLNQVWLLREPCIKDTNNAAYKEFGMNMYICLAVHELAKSFSLFNYNLWCNRLLWNKILTIIYFHYLLLVLCDGIVSGDGYVLHVIVYYNNKCYDMVTSLPSTDLSAHMCCVPSLQLKGKVFYGQEPPSGESTTTECGFNYQLLAVIYWSSPMGSH